MLLSILLRFPLLYYYYYFLQCFCMSTNLMCAKKMLIIIFLELKTNKQITFPKQSILYKAALDTLRTILINKRFFSIRTPPRVYYTINSKVSYRLQNLYKQDIHHCCSTIIIKKILHTTSIVYTDWVLNHSAYVTASESRFDPLHTVLALQIDITAYKLFAFIFLQMSFKHDTTHKRARAQAAQRREPRTA